MKDLPPQPPPQPPPSNAVAAVVPGAAVTSRAGRPYEPAFGNLAFYLLGRLCAALVDVLAIGFIVATFAFHASIGSGTAASWLLLPAAAQSEGLFAGLAGLSIGCALLLSFLTEALVGTTIGKLLFALNVRTLRGGWAGFGRVFVRNILRPLDLLLIGPLLAAVTPKHQRLGDLLAGTVVARSVIGPFAPMLAIGVLSAIGYAQVLFGGGLTSVLGVAAQASAFGPSLVGRAVNVGRGISGQFPAAAPASSAPDAAAPAVPASAAPAVSVSAAPNASAAPAVSESAVPATAESPAAGASPDPASTASL
jgi:uncharacterized RDD family membrane protein YckC